MSDSTASARGLLQFACTTSEDDHIEAHLALPETRAQLEKSGGLTAMVTLMFFAASFVLAVTTHLSALVWGGILVAFSAVAAGPLLRKWELRLVSKRFETCLRERYRKQPCHFNDVTIDHFGIRSECPCGKHEWPWNAVKASFETPRTFVIRFSNDTMLVFPRAALGTESDTVKSMVAEHTMLPTTPEKQQ
ncbi:MAG: YcxB family protein [Terriglobales bacterium]